MTPSGQGPDADIERDRRFLATFSPQAPAALRPLHGGGPRAASGRGPRAMGRGRARPHAAGRRGARARRRRGRPRAPRHDAGEHVRAAGGDRAAAQRRRRQLRLRAADLPARDVGGAGAPAHRAAGRAARRRGRLLPADGHRGAAALPLQRLARRHADARRLRRGGLRRDRAGRARACRRRALSGDPRRDVGGLRPDPRRRDRPGQPGPLRDHRLRRSRAAGRPRAVSVLARRVL